MNAPLSGIGPRRLAALGVAALVGFLSLGYFARYLLKPYTGLVVNFPEAISEGRGVIFAPRSPLSPAVRAGILPYRDQIVRVGEHPIRCLRDLVTADAAWRTYEPQPVEVVRDQSLWLTVRLEPDLPLGRVENAFTAAFLLALMGLGLTLLLDRGLAIGTTMLAAACFSYALFVAVKPFYYENLLASSLVHAGKLAPWLLLCFGLTYPRPRGSAAVRALVLGAVVAAYASFVAARLPLFAQWSQSGADALLARYRYLGRLANMAEAAGYVAFIALIVTAMRTTAGRERMRIQWMLAGFLVALPPYFFFDQLPMILDDWGAPRIGTGGFASLFLLPMPVLFTVGFVTTRSLDARRLLARFLIYAFVALAAVTFFAWLFDPLVGQLSSHYAMSLRAASLVAVFLLAAALFPAQALLLRVAERLSDGRRRRALALHRENAALQRALDDGREARAAAEAARQRELVRVLRHVEHEAEAIDQHAEEAARGLEAAGAEAPQALARVRAAQSVAARLAEASRALGAMTGGLPEGCDAGRLVAVAIARAQQRVPSLRVQRRCSAVRVRVVPQYVVAALVELLVNAHESAPEGIVTVSETRDGARLRLEVRDTGRGFAPGMAASATEPFTTDKPGHSGIGLYLVRRAAALCGGDVGIAQAEGGVVWIELPLA